MSYSFQIRAATKAAAKLAVAAKFEEVATQQKCHERDKAQALAAADAFVDLVSDDETKDVVVTMNGYLSGRWEGSDVVFIGDANVNVTAGLSPRLVPKAE